MQINKNTAVAVRLGVISAMAIVFLEVLYATALLGGLFALETPTDPISDPYFSAMELLILAMMPPIVLVTIAVHSLCDVDRRPLALAAVIFAALLMGVASAVHFSVLILSKDPLFSEMNRILSFEWPSLVYVLDILAWDIFFSFAVVCMAFAFKGDGLGRWIRYLLIGSGVLAFAGLAGVFLQDMRVRNIGIVGYVGVFPIAVLLIAIHFRKLARRPTVAGPP